MYIVHSILKAVSRGRMPRNCRQLNRHRMHACRSFHITEETAKALYSTVSVGASQEAEQEALCLGGARLGDWSSKTQ
jgi:hypothetical protein